MDIFKRKGTNAGHERAKEPHAPTFRHEPKSPYSESSKESFFIFASMLSSLVSRERMPLSFSRRLALLESIRFITQQKQQQSNDTNQVLTEVVMEGILTSPTLDDFEKDIVVGEGLLEKRWDRVLSRFIEGSREGGVVPYNATASTSAVMPLATAFLNYRRMILSILRASRKLQSTVPEASWQRLKGMIVQTKIREQLDNLLFQVLERTCGPQVKGLIKEDVVLGRYYRLLWPDRLDCEEERPLFSHDNDIHDNDRKIPALKNGCKSAPNLLTYGRVLLPGDLESIDCCPICLDLVQAPALELSCRHAFCGRCITEWIGRQQDDATASSSSNKTGWNCPICRSQFSQQCETY